VSRSLEGDVQRHRLAGRLSRAVAAPGFHGVLAYTLREALWLHEQALCDDILLGYPTVDREAVRRLLTDPAATEAVTLMVDDPAHLDLVDAVRTSAGTANEVRVAIDVDAGLRLGNV
jgi:D-serine deaminase-like pyridoxal phosphate-dependent protein